MKLSLSGHIAPETDTIVRFVHAGERADFSDPLLKSAYAAAFAGDDLILKHKQLLDLRMKLNDKYVTIVFAGFDPSCDASNSADVCRIFDDFRHVLMSLGEHLKSLGSKVAAFDRLDALTFAGEDELLRQVGAALPLCEYRYDKYLSRKNDTPEMDVVLLWGDGTTACADMPTQTACAGMPAQADCADALAEGALLSESMCHARDLINEMACVLTPAELAARTRALGERYGFETEILDKAACEKLGMGLMLAVAAGSSYEPRLIVMRYNGGEEGEAPIALIGKGITYDTGGLHIKTSSMESMRYDMNGAAAVIGAMCAVAGRGLSRNVVAVVAACENAVGPDSYRNGDVIRSMSGRTVFVRNTDAEGRLSMADAITYAIRRFAPSEVIEGAGLTGSVCNFYGDVCAATLATDSRMYEHLTAQTPLTGEKFAAMPYFAEYREKLKSPYADLDNAPAGSAGGILAGCFIAEFAEKTPFMHIDFGALPFTSKKSAGQPEGGTGFCVKSLYYYIKNR